MKKIISAFCGLALLLGLFAFPVSAQNAKLATTNYTDQLVSIDVWEKEGAGRLALSGVALSAGQSFVFYFTVKDKSRLIKVKYCFLNNRCQEVFRDMSSGFAELQIR